MKIKIKYLPGAKRLKKISQGDWIDLYAYEDIQLVPESWGLISLGVAMELPVGYEAHIVSRSSTFKTWGVLQTNGMGIVDWEFQGDNDIWMFPYIATRPGKIKRGDRICQFRIVRNQPEIEFKTVDFLGNENRGGLGSTGRR